MGMRRDGRTDDILWESHLLVAKGIDQVLEYVVVGRSHALQIADLMHIATCQKKSKSIFKGSILYIFTVSHKLWYFLFWIGTITFIDSLRTKEEKVRSILNLETCISVVAAFFYGKFVKDLDKGIDYKKINVISTGP